jgi:hypothetical protein
MAPARDNEMHSFIVQISHYDYESIDEGVDGNVADEIAQVLIDNLPALKVSVKELDDE